MLPNHRYQIFKRLLQMPDCQRLPGLNMSLGYFSKEVHNKRCSDKPGAAGYDICGQGVVLQITLQSSSYI